MSDDLNKTFYHLDDSSLFDENADDTIIEDTYQREKNKKQLNDEISQYKKDIKQIRRENMKLIRDMMNYKAEQEDKKRELTNTLVDMSEQIAKLIYEKQEVEDDRERIKEELKEAERTIGLLQDNLTELGRPLDAIEGSGKKQVLDIVTNSFIEDINFEDEQDYFSDLDSFLCNIDNKNLSKVNRVINTNNKVLILADSHGRQLAELLHPMLRNVNLQVILKPSAIFNQVISNVTELTKFFNKSDHLFVIAGCNDCHCKNEKHFNVDLSSLISVSVFTNVHVFNVFDRYDCIKCNENVTYFNVELQKSISSSNVKLINLLYILKSDDFTKQKIHLNLSGKKKIVSLIASILLPDHATFLLTRLDQKLTR